MTNAEFQEWCGDFLYEADPRWDSQMADMTDELRSHDAHLASLYEDMLRAQDAIVAHIKAHIKSRREERGQ